MKKCLVLIISVISLLVVTAYNSVAFNLSPKAEVSLITCAPGNEVYSVYGHSAIRVKDPAYGYDLAFNYGIFAFEAPSFIYRFASGQTDYKLGVFKFDDFVNSYKLDKRSVYEQILQLSPNEKQKILDFLIWNAKPENRVYRYNFFFDNCASRIRDVLVNNIEGGITFQEKNHSNKTLRRHVKDYHGKLLWINLGVDFVVSSESDRIATFWEEMFLPDYLMNHFAEAVKTKDGTSVVRNTNVIYEAPTNTYKSMKFISPFVVVLLIILVLVYVSIKQFQSQKMNNRLDVWIYGFNGFMGIVMAWFVIYSEHPAMSPNYNLLWALPVNLFFALALIVKKWKTKLKYYHIFITIELILFLCLSSFIPQYFHPVFYLFVITVLSRSLPHTILILRKKV